MLRALGDRCLVITPKHVIEDVLDSVTVIVSSTQRSGAVLLRHTPLADLSVLALPEQRSFSCPSWTPDSALASVLEMATTGTISTREFDGSRTNTQVRVVKLDGETISLEVATPGKRIQQGMSGSLLIIADKAAGILRAVDSLGIGEAYRLDFIERVAMITLAGQARSATSLDPRAAMTVLDRALAERNGAQMMQVPALEQLIAQRNTFQAMDFSGVSLAQARIGGGQFNEANFTLADLADVKAISSDLHRARMAFTTMDRMVMDSARVTSVYAPFATGSAVSFRSTRLDSSNFVAADLRGADFRGASLRGAAFPLADLRGARFDGADLRGAFLTGALLDSATFGQAVFENTKNVLGASMVGVQFDGHAAARVMSARGGIW